MAKSHNKPVLKWVVDVHETWVRCAGKVLVCKKVKIDGHPMWKVGDYEDYHSEMNAAQASAERAVLGPAQEIVKFFKEARSQ